MADLPKQDFIPKLMAGEQGQKQIDYLYQEGFQMFEMANPIIVRIPKRKRKNTGKP